MITYAKNLPNFKLLKQALYASQDEYSKTMTFSLNHPSSLSSQSVSRELLSQDAWSTVSGQEGAGTQR